MDNKIRYIEPDRETILRSIEGHLRSAQQWGDQIAKQKVNSEYTIRLVQYMYKAEGLIELLEAFDCGSVGGFDPDVGSPSGLYSLEERYLALRLKYSKESKKELLKISILE